MGALISKRMMPLFGLLCAGALMLASALFNMSRTLSIGNEGPRTMNSSLALSILAGIPV